MKDRNNIGTLIVATNSYLTYLILINKGMPTQKKMASSRGISIFKAESRNEKYLTKDGTIQDGGLEFGEIWSPGRMSPQDAPGPAKSPSYPVIRQRIF